MNLEVGAANPRPVNGLFRFAQGRTVDLDPLLDVLEQALRFDPAMLRRAVVNVRAGIIGEVALTTKRVEDGDTSPCQPDGQGKSLHDRHVMAWLVGVRPIPVCH